MNAATFDKSWAKSAFDDPKVLLANAPKKRASADEIRSIANTMFPFQENEANQLICDYVGDAVMPTPAPRPPGAPRKNERRYPLYAIDEIENSQSARNRALALCLC